MRAAFSVLSLCIRHANRLLSHLPSLLRPLASLFSSPPASIPLPPSRCQHTFRPAAAESMGEQRKQRERVGEASEPARPTVPSLSGAAAAGGVCRQGEAPGRVGAARMQGEHACMLLRPSSIRLSDLTEMDCARTTHSLPLVPSTACLHSRPPPPLAALKGPSPGHPSPCFPLPTPLCQHIYRKAAAECMEEQESGRGEGVGVTLVDGASGRGRGRVERGG
ncbi:unnamed protein product [Closterium sp. NIES-65]|nr:unnamed protein product [Closterium sp. NIES-65]